MERCTWWNKLLAIAILGAFFAAGCAALKESRPILPIKEYEKMIVGRLDADYIGTDNCLRACHAHDKIRRDFDLSTMGAQLSRESGLPLVNCESCHGPGSLHIEVGGGRGQYIINPGKDPEPCYQCHLETKVAFNLRYHHPVKEGRINCTNCHNPHGEDIYKAKGMAIGRENEVCRECHREKTRPRVFEHEALREGCTACHSPHGSVNKKMLVENDNNLCLKCHAQIAMPGSVSIGVVSHTARLALGACWSAGCHTAVHGSDINSHLRY